jgi:threonine dehydrogenase-like Zn-dependent dehydrogenase
MATAAQPTCEPLGRRRPSGALPSPTYCPKSRVRYTKCSAPVAVRPGWCWASGVLDIPPLKVVIYGAGPVGLMAAHSAMTKGACMVMVVDRHPDRLKLAASIGALPIDDSKVSPVDQVMELTNGIGADRGCECVGYQGPRPGRPRASQHDYE